MRVRVYPTRTQRQQWSTALWATHCFRNEAVAFLNTSRRWFARHPALTRDQSSILEEFQGSVASQLSRWLTARLELARLHAKSLPEFSSVGKCDLVDAVCIAWCDPDFRERVKTDEASGLWLLTIPRTALDQVCQDLAKTTAKARKDRRAVRSGNTKAKPAGFPQFRKWAYASSFRLQVNAEKNQEVSAAWPNGIALLPWAGELSVRDDRALPNSCPKLVTLSRDASGRWYASFRVDGSVITSTTPRLAIDQQVLPRDEQGNPLIVGVDVGLKDLATRSDGAKSGRERHLKKYASRLRSLNKEQARRRKGSGRWKVTRQKVGKLHCKVADIREASLCVLAQDIVSQGAIFCLEDLNLRSLLQTRLAASVADASLGRLRQLITHYAHAQGKLVLLADRFDPTTQTCGSCGHTTRLSLNDRTWTCGHCHTHHDRDVNAANMVVVFALMAALTCGNFTDQSTGERPDGEAGRGKRKLHPDLEDFLGRGGLASVVRQRTASWTGETSNGQRLAACLEHAGSC